MKTIIKNTNLTGLGLRRSVMAQMKEKWPNHVISQGFVRSDAKITNTNYFKFKVSPDTSSNTVEQRLEKTDFFICTHVGLYLKVVVSDEHGMAVPQTFPNPNVFVADTNFVPGDLELIYNGYLTIRTGPTIWIDKLETLPFRNVPILPGGLVLSSNYDSGGATENTHTIDESPFSIRGGQVELEQVIELPGGAPHEITLTVPAETSIQMMHTTANHDNYVSLVLRGLIAKNVLQ